MGIEHFMHVAFPVNNENGEFSEAHQVYSCKKVKITLFLWVQTLRYWTMNDNTENKIHG